MRAAIRVRSPSRESVDGRQLERDVRFEYLTDLDNRLLTRNLEFDLIDVEFESGDEFGLSARRGFERLTRPFAIHQGADGPIVVPVGDYLGWEWSGRLRTAGRRRVSGNLDVSRSDFWSGERTQVRLGGTIRPRLGVSLSTDYERNEVRLEQGEFDTQLVRLSAGWNLNPLTSFNGSVQNDDVSRVIGLFLRARWIVRPGSEIFLVWTHNWENHAARLLDRELTTLSRGGAMKVNYTYRF